MQVKYNSEKKQTMQNTAKQNYPGSVIFYNTRTTKRGGVILLCPEAKTGLCGTIILVWLCSDGPVPTVFWVQPKHCTVFRATLTRTQQWWICCRG